MGEYLGVITGLLIGLTFVGLGLPLMRNRVPRNGRYGYRIPATLRDDRVWYPVNARGGRDMVIAGTLSTLIGVAALPFWGDESVQSTLAFTAMGIVLTIMLVSTIGAIRLARRLQADAERGDQRG